MLLIPAIDLLDGKVVRLKKGIMENATEYGHDPRDAALMFAELGAKRIHIVDLNGARTGENQNYKMIEEIAAKSNVEIEVGGGIRDMRRLDDFINMGVNYTILGTVAVKKPEFVKEAMLKYPGKIVLGIDAKNGKAATEGWYEASSEDVINVINRYKGFDCESVIFTDIEKDGMLGGLNIGMIRSLADVSPFPIIASGGVASLDDLKSLKQLNHKNIKGCVIGKAIYEGYINLDEAFRVL